VPRWPTPISALYFEWNQSLTYVTTRRLFRRTRWRRAQILMIAGNADPLDGAQMMALQEKLAHAAMTWAGIDGILRRENRARLLQLGGSAAGSPADA